MLRLDYLAVEAQIAYWRDVAADARTSDAEVFVKATAVVVALNALRDPAIVAQLEAERFERVRVQPSLFALQ
ncbi:hypothetical protein [Nevskia sp.]|uniref:hypothetical protein n=1 Tax=Nevskia sp. TaxID=1929292 RepID=UPI0025F63371|nr:hypothetical protein [Nevskia sp.]